MIHLSRNFDQVLVYFFLHTCKCLIPFYLSPQDANRVSSKYNDLPSPPPNTRFPSDQDGYERYYQGSGGLKLADRSGAPDHFTMPPPPSSGTLDEHGRLTDQLAGLHMRQSSSPTRADPLYSPTNSPSYQQLMSLSPNQPNHECHPTDELSLVPPPPLSPHTYPYESERLLRERVCRTRVRADRSPSTEDAFFQAQPYMAGVAVGMSPVPDRREWPTLTHTLSRLPQSSTGAARWKNTSPVRSLSGTTFRFNYSRGTLWSCTRHKTTSISAVTNRLLHFRAMYGSIDHDLIAEAFSGLMTSDGLDVRMASGPGASSPSYNTSSPSASSPYTSHNVAPGGRFGNAEPHYNGAAPYTSPPGSSSSSGPPYRAPYSQQYDQINSTQGGGAAYAPSVATFYRPDRSTANWGTGPIQREPPKEFKPRPLAPEMSVEKPQPQELPSVGDTTVPRFGSFDVFRRVDEHAVSISQQQQDNFNQLIWQLIYARNITDELEKVRVIFLWLCTKDLHRMNFDNVKPDSPEEILMGIRTGKSTYAQIFYTLCRYAGLHCKLLIGYAKGAEYAPGMHFSGRQGQHSWNAVLVDKVWRLVDCHWAARRLIGKRPSPENVRYGLDMFYFLANPGQLIYTHFPHDSDWQLLRHPISLKEFENLAPVKSAFFKYNLNLVTHRNAVIVTIEPEVRVEISFPSGADQYMSFTFGLSIDNKEGSEEYRGLPLSYGPNELAKNYSILPQYSECTLCAQRGCLELRFRLGSPGSNGPPARLMGKLRCTLVAEEALSRSLLQRNVNGGREAVFVVFLPEAATSLFICLVHRCLQVLQQMRDNQVFFLIRFPHPGFFKFQIYALPFSEPGESLPGVFNYLLEATQVHRGRNGQVMPFPQQFAQWKEGCYLYTPLDGVISPASSNGGSISGQSDTVSFRVSVPRAHAVAVVVGDDWTHLGKVLDRWEGQVSLKLHWGRERQLALCANYDNGDGNYGTLLEYRLSSR
ncbi:putative tgc transglutaminase/protease domain-containing protein involved in cytokinesis [Fasciola gigantica]|uniref:Putative tgc transglutaminase/protease domain-containing protein involved in cytokinesis n=1 Tax=Fasciola gigantica TaxID=46835 RepID=A0A504YY26_FASGI|nr:putative tgc transglutaminase/protease domain-containing protein involved in cytokinesis [Fasciola gigantica]